MRERRILLQIHTFPQGNLWLSLANAKAFSSQPDRTQILCLLRLLLAEVPDGIHATTFVYRDDLMY